VTLLAQLSKWQGQWKFVQYDVDEDGDDEVGNRARHDEQDGGEYDGNAETDEDWNGESIYE
jgi:hypothetical protein